MVIIIELYMCGYMQRARKSSFFNFVLNAKIHGLGIGTYLVQVIFLQEIHLLSQQGIHHLFKIETDCNLIARHTSAEVSGSRIICFFLYLRFVILGSSVMVYEIFLIMLLVHVGAQEKAKLLALFLFYLFF